MNALLGMGLLGWIVAPVIGFVIGGLFFLSMKLQVEYVVEHKGPIWLLPAVMYARLVLVAAVLVLVALLVPARQLPAAMVAGVAGAFVARVLVGRMVRRRGPHEEDSAHAE